MFVQDKILLRAHDRLREKVDNYLYSGLTD